MLAVSRQLPLSRAQADGVEEDLAEGLTEQTVYDEVPRRVEHDENVTDSCVVVVEAATATLFRRRHRPEDLVDESRRLAADEDKHDHDDAARDVVRPLPLTARQQALPLSDDAHGVH